MIVSLSVLTGCQENAEQSQISVSEESGASAFYGVMNSNLSVSDILWKDYPGWQTAVEDKVLEVKEQDVILKGAKGYHWKVLWSKDEAVSELTEGEYIIGCILPQATEMQLWSLKENRYAERNLQPYFDVFRLSQTYTDELSVSVSGAVPSGLLWCGRGMRDIGCF